MAEYNVRATVEITGDCGHKFPVSVAGLDTQTDLVCPTCGAIDHVNDEQLANIQRMFNQALAKAGTEKIGKQFSEGLARAARGKKNITYRPK
jgi:hypothetical protein